MIFQIEDVEKNSFYCCAIEKYKWAACYPFHPKGTPSNVFGSNVHQDRCTPNCPINFRFPLENIISITRLFGGDNYYYFVCARLAKAVDYKFYLLRIYLRHNTHENPIILDIWVFLFDWSVGDPCVEPFIQWWKGFMEIKWYLK